MRHRFLAARNSLLAAGACLLLVACAVASAPEPDGPMRIVLGDSPQRGPGDAWVTLVEFADFQCPYSADEEGALQAILADLPAEVRLVYKHDPLYPLPHPDSRAAAVAAECARVQGPAPDGYFWQMHDLLFQNQADLSPSALLSYAGQISGLDTVAFSACTATQPPLARVLADQAQGLAAGADRTPTLAVNGARMVGDYAVAAIRARVDAAIMQAEASGIPRAVYYQQAVLGP